MSLWRIQDFPWGRWPRGGGRQLPRWLHFEKFVCQNERIWTLGGGGAPLDPPMCHYYSHFNMTSIRPSVSCTRQTDKPHHLYPMTNLTSCPTYDVITHVLGKSLLALVNTLVTTFEPILSSNCDKGILCKANSRNCFFQKSTIGTTITAIDANNDTLWIMNQKWIKKYPLSWISCRFTPFRSIVFILMTKMIKIFNHNKCHWFIVIYCWSFINSLLDDKPETETLFQCFCSETDAFQLKC